MVVVDVVLERPPLGCLVVVEVVVVLERPPLDFLVFVVVVVLEWPPLGLLLLVVVVRDWFALCLLSVVEVVVVLERLGLGFLVVVEALAVAWRDPNTATTNTTTSVQASNRRHEWKFIEIFRNITSTLVYSLKMQQYEGKCQIV